MEFQDDCHDQVLAIVVNNANLSEDFSPQDYCFIQSPAKGSRMLQELQGQWEGIYSHCLVFKNRSASWPDWPTHLVLLSFKHCSISIAQQSLGGLHILGGPGVSFPRLYHHLGTTWSSSRRGISTGQREGPSQGWVSWGREFRRPHHEKAVPF